MENSTTGSRRPPFGPAAASRIVALCDRTRALAQAKISKELVATALRTLSGAAEPGALDSFTQIFGNAPRTDASAPPALSLNDAGIHELSNHFGTTAEIQAASQLRQALWRLEYPLKSVAKGEPLPVSTTLEAGATLAHVIWTHADLVANGGRRLISYEYQKDLEAAFDALAPRMLAARDCLTAVFSGEADLNTVIMPFGTDPQPLFHTKSRGWLRVGVAYEAFAQEVAWSRQDARTKVLGEALRAVPAALKSAGTHAACLEALDNVKGLITAAHETPTGTRGPEQVTTCLLALTRWSEAWPSALASAPAAPELLVIATPQR